MHSVRETSPCLKIFISEQAVAVFDGSGKTLEITGLPPPNLQPNQDAEFNVLRLEHSRQNSVGRNSSAPVSTIGFSVRRLQFPPSDENHPKFAETRGRSAAKSPRTLLTVANDSHGTGGFDKLQNHCLLLILSSGAANTSSDIQTTYLDRDRDSWS